MSELTFPSFYQAADHISAVGQRQYMGAIRVRLILLAVAATGGAITFRLGNVDWFAWLALTAFVGALAAEVFILTVRPDEQWYEGRAAAESVKTISWRFTVGGDPYPSSMSPSDAKRLFIRQIRDVSADLTHVSLTSARTANDAFPQELWALRDRSFEEQRNDYLLSRVDDQISWYTRKSEDARSMRLKFLVVTIVLEFGGVLGLLCASRTC